MAKPGPNHPCPCGSGGKLKRCCRPLHRGAPAPSPEALMRSRYSAYVLGELDYILDTTHPAGPHWEPVRSDWRRHIEAFCAASTFRGLQIHGSGLLPGGDGVVHFTARLEQGGGDASFSERSTFRVHDGRWKYLNGEAGQPD